MSSIPTKQIDGDVAVGRNVSVGGKATVRGSATIGHNLKVEGWLDAPNVKGPNKGLFKTAVQLREAYPNPHEGWWALVGDTLPAQVYMANGGAWVGQTNADGTPKLAGNPTVDSSEYMEAVEEMTEDLEAVKIEVNQNKEDIRNLRSGQTTQGNQINLLQTAVETAQTQANKGVANAATAQAGVNAINNSKGKANGFAPLDANAKVPAAHLPGYVDDVVEFNAFVEGVTPQMASANKNSTDAGCMVVYDVNSNCFLLAVSNRSIASETDWNVVLRPQRLASTPSTAVDSEEATKVQITDYWNIKDTGITLIPSAFTYYNNWLDAEAFGTVSTNGRIPVAGKIYTCTSVNTTSRWSGSELVKIGSDLALGHTAGTAFPGDEGAQLQENVKNQKENLQLNRRRIDNIKILPFNGIWDGQGAEPTNGIFLCPSPDGGWYFREFDNTGFYDFPEEDYNCDLQANSGTLFRHEDSLYRIKHGEIETFVTDKNLNEATDKIKKPRTFINANQLLDYSATYTIGEVSKLLETQFGNLFHVPGIVISFRGKNSWESKQWNGDDSFTEDSAWTDFGVNGNNIGNTVNVNDVCGDTEYTLSTAIKAVQDKEAESGIKYFKSGVVLTYKTAEKDTKGAPVWEAYQFTREIADINPADLKPWIPFGGGGKSEIETKDDPAAGGKDAFSTGGAYKHIPLKYRVIQDDGTVTIQPMNEAGEDIGESITFFASQGGGGEVSGTIVNIKFQESPLYGAVGKDIIGHACIRSVTQLGATEQLNSIVSLKLIDRDTNVVIREWTVNTRSSDEDEYNFDIPFSGLFDGAGSRRFRLEATDDTDHTGYRFITVTAVDATVESTQVLNYTSDYVIPYGSNRTVNVPLYRFPQNVSEKGIQAFIEIWWNGEWRPLTATPPTHFDAYSNSAQFNPTNLFGGGEKMQHGAYPLRIHGRDVASGVTGNTIYTAVMCIDPNSSVPVVALRYNDTGDGTVRLYDRIKVEVAAYNPNPQVLSTYVALKADDRIIGRYELGANQIETAEMQVSGYQSDGSDKINIKAEAYDGDNVLASSGTINLTVKGSAIDAALMAGELYHFDFSGRSNSEPSHEIEEGDYHINVHGANWSSNGFVNYLGQNALRIAENVTAELNHAPFSSRTIEATGMAYQIMFATNNIKDAEAMLLKCVDPDNGAGFFIKGNKVGLQCKTGQPALIERRFPCGEMHTVAIVVEPATTAINRNGTDWATMRMYLDGDLVGAIGYNPGGSRLLNMKNVEMDGTDGDLYLYYMLAYQSYYDWSQAFRNYIVKLTDTDAMIAEFNRENVLVSQNAEGSTSMRPSAPLLFAQGMPYCVFVADDEVHNQFDFGKGVDDNGTSTSDKFKMTVYYYHPTKPWRSFKAILCEIRRQGTTSAKRPKKNYRIYIKKATEVIPLYPDYTNEDALITYALFAMKKIRVTDNSIPVDVITIKVDYSNSGGANDCSVCDMVNATYRALGEEFLTPAQRCYDGTWTKGDVNLSGLQMNHSTANHPIAVFRSNSDTLQNVWFESKGNWKEDKGEQVALGFKDVPGYNMGCLNFQDEVFNWVCGNPGESLDQMEARFKTMEGLDTGMPYLLYPYCSRNYRFMRYQNGQWKNTTGSWIWTGAKTRTITGDVLNPVGGFELLTYEGFDWWQGVSSVEDMMKPSKNIAKWVQKLIDKSSSGVTGEEFPAWTYYFECMVDNDALQADLAMGRIVPFELYVQLRLCDYCDYAKHPDEWVERWSNHAYKFRNVRSDMVYLADADYQNEFDSLSKNHQPMHFLLEGHNVVNGVYDPDKEGATSPDGFNCDFVLTRQPVVQNANKKYDIDGAYMSDNDGGDTGQPEADPTKPSDEATGYVNPWAGWGAVPWRGYFAANTVKTDDNGSEIEYQKTVAAMRAVQVTLDDGRTINPFSPEGAKYYFVDQHLKKWAKVVSSYDGIRKYIKYTATSDALYFYALQGLGLAAVAQFIEQRWRFRDGFYKTGGFFTGVLSGRIACGDKAAIRIVAAKSGYFGMGNDSSGSLSADGAVYLEEGEEYIFTNFSHQQGALLYIYQADRIREIEFTDVSLSDNFDFSVMKLAEKIIIGGENYKQYTIGYNPLTQFALSELPFLKELDIRNTPATSVDTSKCPRLEKLLAGGTQLSEFQVAQTSPVNTLQLPGTVTRLDLVNLPMLTFPGGLTIESMERVNRLMLSGCPHVDPMSLINGIINSSSIQYIRLPDVNITAPSSILTTLKASGAVGLDSDGAAYEEKNQCSGITGRWICEDLIEDSTLNDLGKYFPQLELYNAQFSMVTYTDTADDPENISNPENKTGYLYGNKYVPSGHFKRLEELSHGVRGMYDSVEKAMMVEELDDNDYNFLADGTSIGLTDASGLGYDYFKDVPDNWYKGVNDFKNQQKHGFRSINKAEPLSTASKTNRSKLSELLVEANSALVLSQLQVGSEPVRNINGNMSVYAIDVEGMKQVRWPGVNSAEVGCAFLDANGKIIEIFQMAISNAQFDFIVGEDYIFTNVPSGAAKFMFTSQIGCDDQEAIAVDSSSLEAIEPDWVFCKEFLVGIYGMGQDGLNRARSISGTKAVVGTGTATTSPAWTYDENGKVTNLSVPAGLNRTYLDCMNLCEMRGEGYHAISYEQSKNLANIIMELTGTRDIQAICGRGNSAGYTTGTQTISGKNINAYGNITLIHSAENVGNLMFGIQEFVGCNFEWMAHVAMNVKSFKDWKAKKYPTDEGSYPLDTRFHIYDVVTDTERSVQATPQGSGYCISRVRFGRYMDVVPGKCSNDNSAWNQHYSDKWEYSNGRCRVVGRAGVSAYASGGLVYASASYVSSNSYTGSGSRLAFSGKIIHKKKGEKTEEKQAA